MTVGKDPVAGRVFGRGGRVILGLVGEAVVFQMESGDLFGAQGESSWLTPAKPDILSVR